MSAARALKGEDGPPAPRPRWAAPVEARARRRAFAAAGAVAALAGVVLGVALGVALGAAAGAAGVVVYAAALGGWVHAQGRRALRASQATRLEASGHPRVANLVAGLAGDVGIPPPSLWLIPAEAPNALVCRARGRACLGVTRGLLEGFTRTELEAVVAHCLVRLSASALGAESLAAALGGRLPGAPVLVGSATDAEAAALTRYPPALAAAVAKAAPAERFAAFWFVAEGPSHESVSARVASLADL